MLKGKKVLLGISGSISAYKSASLVRLLVKSGVEVKTILTKAGSEFITPLTLSTLSKNKVLSDLVDVNTQSWNNHVELAHWADLFLIAPASANTLSKCANGICDNLLIASYLSARCPVFFAPAMDSDMWVHPSTKKNIQTLINYGNFILPVATGELASGLNGEGRMLEPEEILKQLSEALVSKQKKKFAGKTVLVNGGPTYEPIDPVRFIGNHSSGKMGVAIANEFARQGANVNLVLGPSALIDFEPLVSVTHVVTAQEMFENCKRLFSGADIIVLSAAVADFTPSKPQSQKIKKGASNKVLLSLKKSPDILKSLGELKKKNQFLMGFALETNDEMKNATAKIKSKNLDAIVLNSLRDKNAGFKHDTNKIKIIDTKGKVESFKLKSKNEVANDIVNFIQKKIHV